MMMLIFNISLILDILILLIPFRTYNRPFLCYLIFNRFIRLTFIFGLILIYMKTSCHVSNIHYLRSIKRRLSLCDFKTNNRFTLFLLYRNRKGCDMNACWGSEVTKRGYDRTLRQIPSRNVSGWISY